MAFGITDSTIEEIKARVDLADLISSYGVVVKSAGSSKKACCPFHGEKTPSFNINERKGFYHCFGCGESGDAIKFVMKMDGLTFIEAVKKLASQCGVEIKEKEDPLAGQRRRLYSLMAELAAFYHRCLLKTKEASAAREYLASRALDGEVAESWTIGYAMNGVAAILKWAEKYGYTAKELEDAGVIKAPNRPGDQGYHRFGGRLMFSIRDKQGRVVAFSGRQLVASKNSGKYVNSPETAIFKKSNVLFGFDRAAGNIAKDAHHEAIVCEGQIDTIRLHLSGFPVAVASQGTAFTEEHVAMLKKVADQVTLVFDDDAAGHKATIRTAGLFLAAEMPVRVVSLPGGEDPDSFLRKHPASDFRSLLNCAESIMSFQCRAERAKEERPDSVDAIARITRAVLATIVQSKNAIQRASMLGEAARLLKLPETALQEELKKVSAETSAHLQSRRTASPASAALSEIEESEFPEEYDPEVDFEGEVQGAGEAAEKKVSEVIPPSPKELAFCEFLMANEYDGQLEGMIGEFLPSKVFSHPFVSAFVDAWRNEVAKGSDVMGDFADALDPEARAWFDAILLGAGKSQSSSMDATDILQNFVRVLWSEALKRRRGELPATGDESADIERMRISMDLKRLARVKWHDVKDLVRTYIKGGN